MLRPASGRVPDSQQRARHLASARAVVLAALDACGERARAAESAAASRSSGVRVRARPLRRRDYLLEVQRLFADSAITTARALRVAGKVDPVFVDEIGAMASTIVSQAQAGDVVIAMGAGSIGTVPAQVAEMLHAGRA